MNLLDQLITAMLGRVERAGQKRRLRTLKDLDVAALLLHEACLVVLDPGCADRGIRNAVFARVPRDQLTQAVAKVADLIGTPDDHYFEDLRSRYSQVRRFMPALQEAVEFAATDAGRPATEAFRFLKTIEGQKRPDMSRAPRDSSDPGLAAGRRSGRRAGSTASSTHSASWNGSRTASAAVTCSCPRAVAGGTRTPSSCKGRAGRRCGRASVERWDDRQRRPVNWKASANSSMNPTGGPRTTCRPTLP